MDKEDAKRLFQPRRSNIQAALEIVRRVDSDWGYAMELGAMEGLIPESWVGDRNRAFGTPADLTVNPSGYRPYNWKHPTFGGEVAAFLADAEPIQTTESLAREWRKRAKFTGEPRFVWCFQTTDYTATSSFSHLVEQTRISSKQRYNVPKPDSIELLRWAQYVWALHAEYTMEHDGSNPSPFAPLCKILFNGHVPLHFDENGSVYLLQRSYNLQVVPQSAGEPELQIDVTAGGTTGIKAARKTARRRT
jgi:hypothetical protein